MIKNILLPEKYGERYLFSQRIVGVDIGKSSIHAAQVLATGTSVTIEQCVDETLDPKNPGTERIVAALQAVFSKLAKPDQIRTTLSSTSVVFKELKLPFLDAEMIKQVIRFEVEPLLPFSLNDAVVDCIITRQHPEEKASDVLIAAVQKQVIAQHLALFEQAGINPDIITIDMFALYGLYSQIPAYAQQTGIVILADIGSQATRLAYIENTQLRMIRTLPLGTHTIAKDINTADANSNPQQALEHLIRFGLSQGDSAAIQQATKTALEAYLNRIQFALTSLIGQSTQKKIEQIILIGDGAMINGISQTFSDTLSVPCSLFNGALLSANGRYVIKNNTVTPDHIMSIAAALPTPLLEEFNMRTGEFAVQDSNLLAKQLIIGIALSIIIVCSLTLHSCMQTRRLKKEIRTSQNEAVDALKEQFPAIAEDETDLEEVVTQAQSALRKEEEIWLAFTSQSRASFLEYLLELTSRINKQETGFIPEQLTIVDGPESRISLKGRVRDFEALKKLESELRSSKLFSYVEGQTALDFTMKITVARKEGL